MIRAEPADTKPKTRGIQDMALGRVDLFRMAPRDLTVDPGWNSRTKVFDHTDPDDIELARSIAEVGVKNALTVYMRAGVPVITDGHRRFAATLYAMDVLGAKVHSVPVQTEGKHANEADRVLSQIVRNSGKPLDPFEKGNVFAKLMDLGWKEADIAAKVGLTRQRVADLLKLRAAPKPVADMVKAGTISAGLAIDTMRASKGDDARATEVLAKAVTKARAAGKDRATAKHVEHVERATVDLAAKLKAHPAYVAATKRAAEIVRIAGHPALAAEIDAALD